MRIAAWDLETTGLTAIMGIILCSSTLEIVPPEYHSNHHDTPPQPKTKRLQRTKATRYDPNPDHELVVAIRDELEQYNCIVTWNGKMYDLPILNARLAFFGERPYKPQFHIDAMWFAGGSSLRIGSKKLINVQKFFGLGDTTDGGKTDIDWDTWKAAALGAPSAMKEVVTHCEADIKVTAAAYWKLLPMIANVHR